MLGTFKCPTTPGPNERVELLKSHFAAGLSCREIANEIGVSRNAVIGKLSRLNLTREKTLKPRKGRRREKPSEIGAEAAIPDAPEIIRRGAASGRE